MRGMRGMRRRSGRWPATLGCALLLCTLAVCEKTHPAADPGAEESKGKPAAATGGAGEAARPLTDPERSALLKLARRSLVASVSGLHPRALTDGLRITARLKHRQGAFVTLKKGGRLRGCIGYIQPRAPLYQAVINNARNAALRDQRFPNVSVGELQDVEIEISALSVPREVSSHQDIVIGRHGIILAQGRRSATYLPHVATEQQWDRPTTLSHLSRKAGLPPSAWNDPRTRFRVYTAQVWSEGHLAGHGKKTGSASAKK